VGIYIYTKVYIELEGMRGSAERIRVCVCDMCAGEKEVKEVGV